MLRLSVSVSVLGLLACFVMTGTQGQLFQLADEQTKDSMIGNLTIQYPDGTSADGFRIIYGNQPKLILWSTIVSLHITSAGSNSADSVYVECAIQLPDGTNNKLSCVNGVVRGKTRNGDYSKPLGNVLSLAPLR